MWLLVLLVAKCTKFLLEAGVSHGSSLFTRWLLTCYSFMLYCSCSVQLLMRYSIKEDTDLDKDSGILPGRCYFFLFIFKLCPKCL